MQEWAYEMQANGKLLFPSWEAAVTYIELCGLRNFKLSRLDSGKAELEIFRETEVKGGCRAG